jgi:glycosyltransferase involved in cell wall biosynthesis
MTMCLSCAAPYGAGGLGQHLAQVVEEARAAGQLLRYFAAAPKAGDSTGEPVARRWLGPVARFTPVRFSPAWKAYLGSAVFDRAVAGRLPAAHTFVGFAGMSLASFRRARRLGSTQLRLESPTAHVQQVRALHERAYADCPVEGDWLGPRLLERTLEEYELADVIVVNSEYVRQSFLARGFPEAKLQRRHLSVDGRFALGPRRRDGRFRVVYVGSLYTTKGIAVLLKAFHQLLDPMARLTLVGGSGSRGMRRYLERCLERDHRVRIEPGDPLPHLQAADVYVHPSYQDGFGLAPMEALACGVPVLVTEDTGMKEHVRPGENGFVVPTGDAQSLLRRLQEIRASHHAASSGSGLLR